MYGRRVIKRDSDWRNWQDYVDKICNAAKESGIVNRLIVFGSAVTEHCSHESDLDICVDTDCADNNRELFKLYARMSKICDYNCDILTYSKLGEGLKTEIDQTGIVVYTMGSG